MGRRNSAAVRAGMAVLAVAFVGIPRAWAFGGRAIEAFVAPGCGGLTIFRSGWNPKVEGCLSRPGCRPKAVLHSHAHPCGVWTRGRGYQRGGWGRDSSAVCRLPLGFCSHGGAPQLRGLRGSLAEGEIEDPALVGTWAERGGQTLLIAGSCNATNICLGPLHGLLHGFRQMLAGVWLMVARVAIAVLDKTRALLEGSWVPRALAALLACYGQILLRIWIQLHLFFGCPYELPVSSGGTPRRPPRANVFLPVMLATFWQ